MCGTRVLTEESKMQTAAALRVMWLGLVWIVVPQAAPPCADVGGKADPSVLEQKAPIAGEARRSVVHVLRQEARDQRIWLRGQRAIEYAASVRTPVAAVHAGRVASARTYPDYGNAIILDHGSGIATLNRRLDNFDVNEGDASPPARS